MTFETIAVMPGVQDEAALADDDGWASSANAQLGELVAASGLPPAVALTIFNRGLAAAQACSQSQWNAWLAEPGSERFRALSPAQLAHAIFQFARIGVHRTPA